MENTKTIDACGLSCPQPALLTRQALSSLTGGTVNVLVDSTTARDNVARTAESAGWKVSIQDKPDGSFQISISR
jgi:TusA-related sulfurtransferase